MVSNTEVNLVMDMLKDSHCYGDWFLDADMTLYTPEKRYKVKTWAGLRNLLYTIL